MKLAVGIAIVILILSAGTIVMLRTTARGFSAREEPTALERFLASRARKFAASDNVKSQQNPEPNTSEVIAEGRAHWADHCATCHGNNGSGNTEMGKNLYPRAPDMRQDATQKLSDGELFYIIENGIRLTGMPAWGNGSAKSQADSWKLVRFIRHLPQVSDEEEHAMQKMNPKTPAELQEESEEERFLKGDNTDVSAEHSHHHH